MKHRILVVILFFAISTAKSQSTGKPVFENEKLKVTEYVGEPGKDVCGVGQHSHPAHLTILLTAASVKVILPDGKTVEQKAPAGATFWTEAETHTVINNGSQPVRSYIVLVKQ